MVKRRLEPEKITIFEMGGASQSKHGLIVLELGSEAAAIRVAEKIAKNTGRSITVRDAHLTRIAFIRTPTRH